MDDILQLKQSLQRINYSAFQNFYFDHRPIQQHAKRPEFQAAVSGRPGVLAPDRSEIALLQFLAGEALTPETVHFVCYSAAIPTGDPPLCIFDNADRFQNLLVVCDGYADQAEVYRRCYRGLLSSYFQYAPPNADAQPAAFTTWQAIREALQARLPAIAHAPTPDWVLALQEHPLLFSDQPVTYYATLLQQGQKDLFLDAQQRLHIPGASWFSQAVIAARLSEAAALSDADFRKQLPPLLKTLGDWRCALSCDKGLVTLLDRYALQNDCVFDAPLCDFAVEHWGNPWFCVEPHRWEGVSEAARSMVESWIDPDLVKIFFTLLATDGQDQRRLAFWQRYASAITDVHCALGRYAMQSQDRSFINLRKKLGSRLHGLLGSGQANNALILISGEHTIVEFGVKGDAAYVHPQVPFQRKVHFQLERSHDLSLETLMRTQKRLDHKDNDNGYEYWEQYFDAYLYQNFRIRASAEELPEPWRSGMCLTALNPNTLSAFCEAFSVETRDDRATGGFFWAIAENTPAILDEQLRAWGFNYRVGKGWSWKNRPGRSEI